MSVEQVRYLIFQPAFPKCSTNLLAMVFELANHSKIADVTQMSGQIYAVSDEILFLKYSVQ